MSQLEKQEKLNITHRRVFFSCFAAYCYSSWLSLVLVETLAFSKAENVYFAVFLSIIFFIFYVIFSNTIISKLWFWAINSLGVILLMSYWLWAKWGVS